MLKGKNTFTIVKMFFDNILKLIEPRLSFPLQKNTHRMTNFTIPSFFIIGDLNFEAKIRLQVKVARKSKFMNASNITIQGFVKR